ncbi:conserved hypothetical protein [Ferroglobus placidus DSM 10642]|uniref:Uncharacterized protein n=1 Tax=Ferroglobus placidus (strain DSM 10642 / AEDII12DO) TaxID=589924 RepID=D3S031_FERPA|nr:hypothetical protein [Ferroglobus placidus]ADC66094.1 conserved hypothetical protein [Ferroglobus placidus DSM 10642]
MHLYIFPEKDSEKILASLKNLKPAFKAEKNYEVFAVSDDGRVMAGKYKKTFFVLSEEDLVFPVEPLESYRIIFGDYGEAKFENSTVYVPREKSEIVLRNLVPFLSEITVAKILIKDARLRAEHLTKEETKIISEVTKILEGAKTLSVSKLEELAYSISSLKGSFFSAYMQFKDELEEISSSLIRAEEHSGELGFAELISSLRSQLRALRQYESSFESTLSGVRDALDTVHLKLESLHRKENLELQRKTSSLQAAAAVIEFIAVFYYSMGIWSKYANLEEIPKWISFSLLAILSTLVVICTEAVGEVLTSKKLNGRFYVVTTLLILVIIAMLLVTVYY